MSIKSAIIAFVILASARALAQVPPPARKPRSAQEESRRKLLEEIGLEKQKAAPAPASTPSSDEAATDRTASDETSAPTSSGVKTAAVPAAPSFTRSIHPALMGACGGCHRAAGPAGATRLLLSGNAASDYAAVVRLVVVREPASSVLLIKASGQLHAGGTPWPRDGAAYGRALTWIARGARLDATPAATAAGPTQSAAASPSVGPASKKPSETVLLVPVPPPISGPAGPPTPVVGSPAVPAPPAVVPVPAPPSFAAAHEILMSACSPCHRAGAVAAKTALVLTGNPASDEAVVRGLIEPAAPKQSLLLAKASGAMHGGGTVLSEADPRYAVLLAWATPSPTPQITAVTPTTAPPPLAAPPSPSPQPPRSGYSHHGGIELPLGFMLNGRFDLDYERRQFTGDPFAANAVNALRSYHHFLFLSRAQANEPCGVSIEILALTFWEAHCRVLGRARPVALTLAGGKIVVPFGADPLFHQSYGGLAGFDQRILPPIWAQEGVAAHAVYERGDLVVTDDLFVVRGYGLSRADGVLNLQNDFSPADDARLGWGNRLGGAWKALSAWYSTYFNPLGFDRHLFMQAIDVTVYRQREIPVLGHFSFGAGLLRADVAGGNASGVGGPGKDYYHFGSYFQVRYHPTDWLYLQYRQGVRSFDNRRGIILDNSRLTSADGSTHNFGIVGRYHALSVGVYYFVNLEKVGEVPDDLFRVSVAYEF